MSKIKLSTICGLLALFGAAAAQATTLEEIAQKNRELQVLKADLEIAKKKSEIKLAVEGKQEGSIASSAGTSGVPLPKASPVKAAESLDADIAIKSISGDVANPKVEFTVNGEEVASVTKGGSIARGWRLASVDGRTVVIEQVGKNGRRGATKNLYLPEGTTTAGVTRYDSPASNGGGSAYGMPTMPSMPGLAMPPLPGAGAGGR